MMVFTIHQYKSVIGIYVSRPFYLAKLHLMWLLEIIAAWLNTFYSFQASDRKEWCFVISHILHNTLSLFLLFLFCVLFTLFYSEVWPPSLLSSLLLSLQDSGFYKHLAFHYPIGVLHFSFLWWNAYIFFGFWPTDKKFALMNFFLDLSKFYEII